MFDVHATGITNVGCVRDNNEDSLRVEEDLGLYIVCDGMGGHAAGEVASDLCASTFVEQVRQRADYLADLRWKGGLRREDRMQIQRLLEDAVASSCHAVYRKAFHKPDLHGMGCTLTALMVVCERAFVAHVGDSRLYLLRGSKMNPLTRDHSIHEELMRRAGVSYERALEMAPHGGLARAMGVQASVTPDILELEVLHGDRYMLCSDGLCGPVEDGPIRDTLAGLGRDEAAQRLIDQARGAGGPDNVTTIVVDVAREGSVEATASAPEASVAAVASDGMANFELKMSALDAIPMFQRLTYQERLAFFSAAEEVDYQPGQALMTEGEPGEHFFVLVSGECDIRKGASTLARVGAGSPLGDMALVIQEPRSASVVAATPARALVIGRNEFFGFLKTDPFLASKVLWSFLQTVTQRLSSTSRQLQNTQAHLAAVTGPQNPA